ncbi:MAG: hypothetical protein GX446_12435 [Chthonomonadales bacterium]|nr:hypothetical protein [Chthonomonadales bacterium]
MPLSGRYQMGDAEQIDVYSILNELLELPDKAKRLPGNILVGFNHERFGHLVLKIRANLPEDMKRARKVTRDTQKIVSEARDSAKAEIDRARAEADRIVESARGQAERLLVDAREEAARMVDQSEIVRMADAQAREIVHNATVEASGIRRGAKDYARDVLTRLEGVLDKARNTVHLGREERERALDEEDD